MRQSCPCPARVSQGQPFRTKIAETTDAEDSCMHAKTICLLWLALFLILEFLPVPTLTPVLLYVVISRPLWFKEWVDQLYAGR